jgi:predicted secreted protein
MKAYVPLLLAVSFVCASCTQSKMPTAVELDSTIDGGSISLVRSQQFVVHLDAYTDAGYQWDCTIADTLIVRLDSTIYRPKNDTLLVGGLAVASFHFCAVGAGRSDITLIEHRVWEKDIPPLHTVRFTAVVY